MNEPIDEIRFLSSSESRVRILDELHGEERVEKADLRERLDCTRTTIGRHLDALEDRGYIAYDPATNEYDATARGTVVATELAAVVETMATADRLGPFLEGVPEGALDLELGHLADAEIVSADPHDPYAPVNHHVEAVREASRFRCLLPSTGLNQMREVTEGTTEGDECAVIFERDILESILSDEGYEREMMKMDESERFEIAIYDGEIPYFLGIYDEMVHVGVEDDEGIPQALLESDADVVREWAEDTYASYREESTPFD